MSLVNAYSIAHYINLKNNAAYSIARINSSRMNMLSSLSGNSFGATSLEALSTLDTQMELDIISNSLQYKMAQAMLEQLKQQRKEDAKKFSIFA